MTRAPWREIYRIADVTLSLTGVDPLLRLLARSVYSGALVSRGVPQLAYELVRTDAEIILYGKGGEEVFRAADLASAFAELEWLFTSMTMGHSRLYLQVHAAAVSWNGHGILLLGPPASGKTTLAVALALRGAVILTDEIALLRPRDQCVAPFPRDLAMHWRTLALLGAQRGCPPPRSWKSFPGMQHRSLAELGFPQTHEPVPISAVALLERRARALPLLRTAGQAEAAYWILEQAFNLAQWGGAGMAAVAGLAQNARAFKLRWGDAHLAAADLLGRVSAP